MKRRDAHGIFENNLPDLAALFQRRVADRHFVVAIENFVERAELLMKGDPIEIAIHLLMDRLQWFAPIDLP